MVDRITKALRKLNDKEQRALERILHQIKAGDIKKLDAKKLKGNLSIYRVLKGSLRVLYQHSKTGKITVLAVERRSDTTYNKF
jgi:mRNA-degrading endonuclease RelE of RelBE toxin-antitoxin system